MYPETCIGSGNASREHAQHEPEGNQPDVEERDLLELERCKRGFSAK